METGRTTVVIENGDGKNESGGGVEKRRERGGGGIEKEAVLPPCKIAGNKDRYEMTCTYVAGCQACANSAKIGLHSWC